MPARAPAPQTIEVVWTFENSGSSHVSHVRQFWLYSGTAPTNAQLQTFCNTVKTSFSTHLATFMHTSWDLLSVGATDLTSPTSATALDSLGVVAGTNGGNVLPVDTAAMQNFPVHRRYRGGHGRSYWPYGVEAHLASADSWTGAFITAIEAADAAMRGDLIGAAWAAATLLGQVIPSWFSGFTVHTGTTGRARNVAVARLAPVIDPILSAFFNGRVAVQRKRRI